MGKYFHFGQMQCIYSVKEDEQLQETLLDVEIYPASLSRTIYVKCHIC